LRPEYQGIQSLITPRIKKGIPLFDMPFEQKDRGLYNNLYANQG